MPTSNIGEETFHLLPKVIHMLKYSRVEYDSRCCLIAPQCVKSVLTEKELHEQDTEKKKQIKKKKKSHANCISCGFLKPTVEIHKYFCSNFITTQSSGVKSRPNMNHRSMSFYQMLALPGAEKHWVLVFCLILSFGVFSTSVE